ncbi:2-iminoacetate synthase [Desulfosalsimonas propionicica]|uniref:2-iminoacetate synthase n=1 Tax=Desulfosalsimonas propionicica TaxID=332175 RepID=A0A7W0CAP5_9BACT|nr:[FeFe] hydrogenase H-cluster radical SAM maturase HydG [Desulfosalsimonas propionicica]MBA2882268.1 2-iminoacetate synthase [Desulfosalsimonas propionicica]
MNINARPGIDFIDEGLFEALLKKPAPESSRIREILAKSLDRQWLDLDETAILLAVRDPDLKQEIYDTARELKDRVYGKRIVLFAPLYIGNECINDCSYCGFRSSNKEAVRRTLDDSEIGKQVKALESVGHKRLILVYGEHPRYDADFIARTVRTVYETRGGHDEIRRVNINAAPLDEEGYRIVHEAGIGTYQIFQETYHHETYGRVHPRGTRKSDYLWRLGGLDRAMAAGCDDVGIGALFGLYDWRFEALGLVAHALHLQAAFGVGPHTISFPRLQPASNMDFQQAHLVSDDDFYHLVAVLRLAVPYTGLICTARERAEVRRNVLGFGVSQIDAGSRIEIGGYTESNEVQEMDREQFALGDIRPLDIVMRELLEDGYLPSFCTACYRLGRTGEHFMEFSIPGFIKRFCTPNALTTLTEYLTDYASERTHAVGKKLVDDEIARLDDNATRRKLIQRIEQIQTSDARDFYF